MKNGPSKKHLKYFGIVLSVIAIITVVVTTLTWYAHNQKLTATNVKTKVTVSPNLVIADDIADIVNMTLKHDTPFEVSYGGSTTRKMTPATHNLTDFPVNASISELQTGLKTITNAEIINVNTGLAEAGTTIDYKTVPVYQELDNKQYYFDYTVYVASVDTAWEDMKIYASNALASSSTAETYNACSVDFIVDGYYMGTASPVNASPVLIYTGDIPLNTSTTGNQYITILMRCYFDGELKRPDGLSAYVNSTDAESAMSMIMANVALQAVK